VDQCLSECWTYAEQEVLFALPIMPAFQELCEVYGEDGAAATSEGFVFEDELDLPVNGKAYTEDELLALERFAIVGSVTDHPFSLGHRGASIDPSGSIFIHLERLIAESALNTAAKRQTERRWSKKLYARILCELLNYFDHLQAEAGGGRLVITSGELVDCLAENKSEYIPTDAGVWHKGTIVLEWGHNEE